MTIVLAGGSGYIGTKLSKKLLELGHRVVVIDIQGPRFTHPELFFIQCDISNQPLPYEVLEHTDAVVNLAGRTIATKWNEVVKAEIRKSRIDSTTHIVETIVATKNKPSCFICASAVGFYGDTGDTVCDEKCERGVGFLADVVYYWECAAAAATSYGVRTVCIRTAPVLGDGGFLKSLTRSARFGFLTRIAKKNFWMPWIHEDDLIAVYLFALETNTLQGVVNAAAPEVVQQQTFMKALARAMHKKLIGTLPRFVAKRLFGEFYTEMVRSQRVVPQRLLDKGFTFLHPTLTSALAALYPQTHKKK